MLVIISGPGGVGKGTVVSRLLELDARLWLSVSWTTRPRRPGEPEGAYRFVAPETFEERLAQDGFLEWTRFSGNGHLYGTPKLQAPDGRDVLLEIELDGARQVLAKDPAAVLIFLTAPSLQDQEARLRARGDDEASVARRLAVGAEEEMLGRQLAAHVVVNDQVDRAARQVIDILNRHREHPNPAPPVPLG